MFEKLSECPSCGHKEFHNYLITKDYSISQEDFCIVQCNACQLLFTNPRPTVEHLAKYYEAKDYISHSNSGKSIINLIYKLVRTYTLRQKVKLISKFQTRGHLLDYGCGTGHFLAVAQRAGWTVHGIEPSTVAREIAINQIGCYVSEKLTSLDQSLQFDVITLWHVLEHVSDLKETMKLLLSKLKKDGILIVALPNHESFDAQQFGKYWAGYDVPRHLYHFSSKSFVTFTKSFKLKLVKKLPMFFDSYYVSLLSQKYKTGKSNFLKSMLTGYKSNSYASKNKDSYSSIIYILKK